MATEGPLHVVLRVQLPALPESSAGLWLPRLLCVLSLVRDRVWIGKRIGVGPVFPESWTVVFAQDAQQPDDSLLLHATLMSAAYGLLTTADNNVDVFFEQFWNINAVFEDKHLSIFTADLTKNELTASGMIMESLNSELSLPKAWQTLQNARIVHVLDLTNDITQAM